MLAERRKIIKDADARKIFEGVFDESTINTINRLSSKGLFFSYYGKIKEGKESTVILGDTKEGKKVAIKVYAVEASNFKKMQGYLIADPRFEKIKLNKRSIIFAWCKKEFKNLKLARNAGVSCPEPLGFMNNVLVMEFLGDEEPYPRLKDVVPENPEKTFKEVIENMKLLYKKAGIVHGDLSEFNILYHEKPYLIDFSQSVVLSHPNSKSFLERDIKNVCRFFEKLGLEIDTEKILEEIIK